ncbi:MAG TPA: PHP domain-containing protein [Deferrisomatales bacterium]|nr:PHP domain-containing protein [Deferrisomatales bacterium]
MIDLHIHSDCSDGALSPEALVERAHRLGLRALALTDHDTVAGNDRAVAAGKEWGLPVLAGIEISTQWRGLTFHLLGYGVTRTDGAVASTLEFLVESRRQRNPRMVEKLRHLGVEITMEEVRARAGGEVVGRPHFAAVLLAKGVVRSNQEAFDRFLGRGAPAYLDKARLDPEAACRLVHDAGGVAVLAHPGLVERDRPDLLVPLLDHMTGLGMAGIEAYYSRHDPGQTLQYRNLARQRGLLVTGGSDFHAPGQGAPELGRGLGGLFVPDTCWEALEERLATGG